MLAVWADQRPGRLGINTLRRWPWSRLDVNLLDEARRGLVEKSGTHMESRLARRTDLGTWLERSRKCWNRMLRRWEVNFLLVSVSFS